MKNILVPTDFSPCATNALDFAVQPAKVFQTDIIYIMPHTLLLRGNIYPRGSIDCHYPEVKLRLLKGDPENEIGNYLKNEQDITVVLGTYQRSMVSSWFKSSLADSLMEECNVALFIAHYK
ncbi:universal stress protein [Pedobacter sp. P351]|uniref:universal stress protein n=1 Tax=Pedobacter superstes TaxID=3133441 RepID=UPI00309D1127